MTSEKQLPLTDFVQYSEEEMTQKANAFYKHIKRRHSIRKFSDKAVSKSVIENAIKAAGTAPNGANHQPWHFVAISSPDVKKQVRETLEKLQGKSNKGKGAKYRRDKSKKRKDYCHCISR